MTEGATTDRMLAEGGDTARAVADGAQADGQVTVRLFAAAKAAAGTSELRVPPGTVAAIAEALARRSSALAAVLPRCSFLLDGAQPALGPAGTHVAAGSTLDVLPPFAGG